MHACAHARKHTHSLEQESDALELAQIRYSVVGCVGVATLWVAIHTELSAGTCGHTHTHTHTGMHA